MERLVFLCGPITGSSYEEVSGWRRYVADRLPPGISAVSALRGRDHLTSETVIKDDYADIPLSTARGLTCRDRMDVQRCDLLFVNFLGSRRVSIGSVMEIAWADAWRKPIVVVMDKGQLHDHSMIREVAGFVCRDLDEAIGAAVMVLSTMI